MKRVICSISCILAVFPSAYADPTKTPEILVTGTQHPVSADSLPAATTVYSREDIEELQFQDLPQLLNQSVGMDVVRNGGPGQNTSLFVRGTEADHILVLVDGIRVGSATAGAAAYQLIPIYQIERIEILRGPQSSLYGSEAIGGVLQIFTRKGAGPTNHGVQVEAGSFNTKKAGANINGESNGTHYNVSASYLDTDGFSAREPVLGPFGFSQPDDDGHDNTSINLRVGHETENGAELDAFILRAEGTTEFDGTFEDKTDFVQQVAGASVSFNPMAIWRSVLRVGESRDETDNFAPNGSFSSTFDTKRKQAYWINHVDIAKQGVLTLGADYLDDSVESTSMFAETERDNVGIYAQYVGDYGAQQVTAAIRNDDNQAFGNEITGGVGWGYRWPNAIRIYLRAGSAFRAPTFNELYFPNFGNPNLQPETATSYEAGVEGQQQWGKWAVRLFRNNIDDLIVTTLEPVTGLFAPENVEQARIDGIEVEVAAVLAGWNTSLAVTLLDPENRQTGAQLPRRAEESLSFNFTKQFNTFVVGGRVLAKGDRFDDALNTIPVDGYVVVDLLAEYLISPHLSVKALLGNLFDEDYQEVVTFNTPGRNVMFTLQYNSQ